MCGNTLWTMQKGKATSGQALRPDGVGGQRDAPAALPPGNRPDTHCIGGWVGPGTVLNGCGKTRPPPGFDPRTVQSVASRYTD